MWHTSVSTLGPVCVCVCGLTTLTTGDDQMGWNMNTSSGTDFHRQKTACEAGSKDSCVCVCILQECVLFVLLIH